MALLERMTNFQFTAYLLAVIVSSGLLAFGSIGGTEWREVMETSVTIFIGGGALKEAASAIAMRGEK